MSIGALTLSCIAVLATSVLAQSTLPVGYSKKEGEYFRHVPLKYAPCRIQCGYGAKATPWKTVQVINELWARADSVGYLSAGFSVDMRVILSSKGANIKTPSVVYTENLGNDAKVFMKKKLYKFAPLNAGTTFPNPWTIRMKGDAPFVAVAPTLLVDWSTYSSSNQFNNDFYVDTARVKGTPTGAYGTVAYYGTGCNPNTYYNFATDMDVGADFRTYAYTRNIGDFQLAWLGAAKTTTAIPGLKGCSLYTPPVIFHPTIGRTSEASGYHNFIWGQVPLFMKGQRVFSQMAAVDPKGSLRFSRGAEVVFGDYDPHYPFIISHKYQYGSGTTIFDPDKHNAAWGWVDAAIIFDLR